MGSSGSLSPRGLGVRTSRSSRTTPLRRSSDTTPARHGGNVGALPLVGLRRQKSSANRASAVHVIVSPRSNNSEQVNAE